MHLLQKHSSEGVGNENDRSMGKLANFIRNFKQLMVWTFMDIYLGRQSRQVFRQVAPSFHETLPTEDT